MNARMTMTEWLLLLLLAALWSFSYLLNRVALDDIPVATVVLGRVGIAAVALAIFLRARGGRLPETWAIWAGMLVLSLLNNVLPFLLIVGGQTHIDSGLAAILLGVTPLFGLVISRIFSRDEPFTMGRAGGLVLGIAGLVVLVGPTALSGLGSDLLGQGMMLGAALSYAFAAVYGRRFRTLDPYAAAACQLICSTAVLLPIAMIADRPWTLAPGWLALGAVLAIALLATAIAYVIYFRILSTAGSTNLLLVTLLVPPGAVIWGALLLDERVGWDGLMGMGLIIAGLMAIDGRPWEWLRRRVRRAA